MQIKTNTISINYILKWRFTNHPHIQITECKRIFNVKTGREKKLTVNGYSKGLWIDRKFICQKDLNKHIERIPKEYFYNV